MLVLLLLSLLGVGAEDAILPSVAEVVASYPNYTQSSSYNTATSVYYKAAVSGGFSYTIQLSEGPLTYLVAREACAGRGMIPAVMLTKEQNEEV